jgi:large subunit ribosomal protein L18
MATNKKFNVPFRRKREKKTDYHLRISFLKSEKPRLVVRRHLNNFSAQIVSYEPKGDKVLVSAHTRELKKFGWEYHGGNIPSAYLLGWLIGKKAVKKKVAEAIFDIGSAISVKESSLYAVLKGAVEAGMKIPHNSKNFPSDARVKGEAISAYARDLSKSSPEKYKGQFSAYLKKGLNPADITKKFEETKKKIGA